MQKVRKRDVRSRKEIRKEDREKESDREKEWKNLCACV